MCSTPVRFSYSILSRSLLTRPVQYTPSWITVIGIFFCLLNITLFLMNCILLSMRFYLRPGSFTRSFTDQVETLFIPAFVSTPSAFRIASRG